ncbi:MAG: ABC transporter substrate-binding protein [Candidatus Bathyarchaeia archaeon]
MATRSGGGGQLPRMLVFLVIGLVLGGAVTYGALTPTLGQVPELNSKISQLQQQVNQLTQVTEYKIGASMPLTGELSDIGVQWRTVLEMARDDLNSEMAKYGIKARFTLVVQDDKTQATEALKVVQNLAQAGIKVVIGPAGSSQVKACKSFVDDNKIVLITASSTSPTLAIPGDYIFRTVGSDAGQAKALAALVKSQGVNKVIVFHRDDEYGIAFADFFSREFEALGGSSIAIRYASGQADYASEVAQLSSSAKEGKVEGIVMITFDTDGVNILDHAEDDPFLSSLRWFSSEGVQGASGLLAENIAKFIEKTGFMGTRPIFRENPLYKDFAARYKAKAGSDPPVFTANLYDAIFLAGWSIVRVGSTSGEAIKSVLPDVAKKYYGASGWCIFDEAGDKMFQDYSIWTVRLEDGKYQYVDIASYSGGAITWD